ncbi:MAG TPA: hypothetical protein VGS41_04170, partial [Chthonomonadales bacterium]|nr:hypothetical protein [Chthonomonadales bacterium]
MKTGNNTSRIILAILVAAIVIFVLNTGILKNLGSSTDTWRYDQLLQKLSLQDTKGAFIHIDSADFNKDDVTGQYRQMVGGKYAPPRNYTSTLPDSSEARAKLYDLMNSKGVKFDFKRPAIPEWLQTVLSMVLFPLVFIAI